MAFLEVAFLDCRPRLPDLGNGFFGFSGHFSCFRTCFLTFLAKGTSFSGSRWLISVLNGCSLIVHVSGISNEISVVGKSFTASNRFSGLQTVDINQAKANWPGLANNIHSSGDFQIENSFFIEKITFFVIFYFHDSNISRKKWAISNEREKIP